MLAFAELALSLAIASSSSCLPIVLRTGGGREGGREVGREEGKEGGREKRGREGGREGEEREGGREKKGREEGESSINFVSQVNMYCIKSSRINWD